MQITVTDAKGLLLDLVHRAETGEEIILTRHGRPVVRLQAIAPSSEARRRALERARGAAAGSPGFDAARSQDFLYDEHGLPK